jgi:AraC-like DNA-binding protein
MSVRTLHRQLRSEGASLQSIKDEVRQARACELLLRSQRSIQQIAQATGFHNEKEFFAGVPRLARAVTLRVPACRKALNHHLARSSSPCQHDSQVHPCWRTVG